MQPRVSQRIHAARDALERQADSAEAWGHLGKVLHVHREHEAAAICYREAHRLAPDDFRWVYFLARVLELEGHAGDEVIAHYEKALELDPLHAPAHARLGDALVKEGQLDEGRKTLERAVSLNPRLAKARRSLGQVALMLGDADVALPVLEKARDLQPQDGATWAALAQAYAIKGQTELAQEAAAKASALKPIHALVDPTMQEVSDEGISSTICARRAREYMGRGDFENALQQFLIVAETDPANINLLQQIAVVAQRAGQLAVAEKYFEQTIELAPKDPGPRSRLANLLLQTGRAREAVSLLQTAIVDIPESAILHAGLGSALAQAGQPPEALQQFQRAQQLGELTARDYGNWGNTLRAVEQLDEAVLKYETSLRINPKYINAHYNLGSTLERLDRTDEAIEHYRSVVKLNPGHPAKESLARLLSPAQ